MLVMEMIGTGFVVVMALMASLWLVYLFRRNAAVVDIGWAFGFVLLAFIYALMGDGYFYRKWMFAAMAIIWGARLGYHLLKRYLEGGAEDPRYTEIIATFRENKNLKVLFLFLFQGLLVIILSVPFLMVSLDNQPEIGNFEITGLIVWALALWGETVADRQLARFKKYSGRSDAVCQEGWWFYSRHPNYFFEFMIWVGYFIFALSIPWGFLTIYCPLLMLVLLVKIYGIPMVEKQELLKKGETYRQYQQTTSAFIPWFKK